MGDMKVHRACLGLAYYDETAERMNQLLGRN
jgi:hypothetical protein